MAEQEFDELEGGPSTEETPGDEFVWTDDADEQGEGAIGIAGLPGAQAEPVGPYETPEFRELQSRSDQRVAALQAQLASRDQELERLRAEERKIQDRLDADRLRNATPQQIHAYYQERSQREATEQAALTEGQKLERQIAGRAGQVLQAVGMGRETPGLRFGAKVDLRSYVDLLESVVEVQSRAAQGAEGGTRQEIATTEGPEPGGARLQPGGPGVRPTPGVGATPATRGRVSTARGHKPVNLWSSYFKALDRIERGDSYAVVALRKEYEKKGLDFAKMPKRRRR